MLSAARNQTGLVSAPRDNHLLDIQHWPQMQILQTVACHDGDTLAGACLPGN